MNSDHSTEPSPEEARAMILEALSGLDDPHELIQKLTDQDDHDEFIRLLAIMSDGLNTSMNEAMFRDWHLGLIVLAWEAANDDATGEYLESEYHANPYLPE